MGAIAYSVGLLGVEAKLVEVQCAVSGGLPAFTIVGLPDKAVTEARERIRAAFAALQIALPPKRITINLSPANLPKEGSLFDLPIALSILASLDVVDPLELKRFIALGELTLDGRLVGVPGGLAASLAAVEHGKDLLCPAASGAEAAWVGGTKVFAPASLREAVDHLTGRAPLRQARPGTVERGTTVADLVDVRGQEAAKRALEIAAAGRHHLFMIGPPGAGKSMLAQRLPSILPSLDAREALELALVRSAAGEMAGGSLSYTPPFRDPHHTASDVALVGGGRHAKPGAISLAHNGVLFLDEFPEFSRNAIDALRQPLENADIQVARSYAQIRYPAKFLLVAAANHCRCGYLTDPSRCCSRAPLCAQSYLSRISGPIFDRFDLRIEVPAVGMAEMSGAPAGERSVDVAIRVEAARAMQRQRYEGLEDVVVNGDLSGGDIEKYIQLEPAARALMDRAVERLGLSARGYHRILRVARTIGDLDAAENVQEAHIAEALSFRLASAIPAAA